MSSWHIKPWGQSTAPPKQKYNPPSLPRKNPKQFLEKEILLLVSRNGLISLHFCLL
jgi:hypothetical protein